MLKKNVNVKFLLRIFVSETYSIIDAKFADDQSTNKVSSYTTISGNPSLSYANTGITITGSSSDFNTVSPISINGDWSVEADFIQTNQSNRMFLGYQIMNASSSSKHFSFLTYTAEFASYDYNNYAGYLMRVTGKSNTYNKWYHMVLECRSNVLYYKIYDENNTQILSEQANLPSAYQNTNLKIGICAYEKEPIRKFKNVIIKAL